jgi:hypothetical protein
MPPITIPRDYSNLRPKQGKQLGMSTRSRGLCRSLFLLFVLAGCWGCTTPRLRTVYTEHLGQLTGTALNPSVQVGITGTDLGVSFIEPDSTNRLIFLFGDSWTPDGGRNNQDSSAWAQSFILPTKNQITKLTWNAGDQFTPVNLPGVDMGGMNVPVEGVPINGKIYVFASTGWDGTKHCCSALAHTAGSAPDFNSLTLDWSVQTNKFVNISAFAENGTVWIFGSGPYRASAVYLAQAPAATFADRSTWRYFTGTPSISSFTGPGASEEDAQPVVASSCVGELSVRRHPQLGYLMLYNCGAEGLAPRGIHLRVADNPWGPWDPPITIFNPDTDRGYGYFMHRKYSAVNYDDGLAEPGIQPILGDINCPGDSWREECWGGEYGPYLVPSFFSTTSDGGYSIIYTLSSWVPYQAHLMRSVLAKRNDSKPQPPQPAGVGLPPAHLENPNFESGLQGWQSLGDPFVTFKGQDGRSRMTTFTPSKGDAATGALYQDFTVDANTRALQFLVHGGNGTVRLHRGVEIVRETRGRSGHAAQNSPDTPVCWNLADYAGETLRVAIFDDKTDAWGFIGVTGFTFLDHDCGVSGP